jgi:hypothetical protein
MRLRASCNRSHARMRKIVGAATSQALRRRGKPGRVYARLVGMQHQDIASRAVGLEALGADDVSARIVPGGSLGFVPLLVVDRFRKSENPLELGLVDAACRLHHRMIYGKFKQAYVHTRHTHRIFDRLQVSACGRSYSDSRHRRSARRTWDRRAPGAPYVSDWQVWRRFRQSYAPDASRAKSAA